MKLESKQRKRIGIIGPSGSGKTQLLKTILWRLANNGKTPIFDEIHLFAPTAQQPIYKKEIHIKKEHVHEDCTQEEFDQVYQKMLKDNPLDKDGNPKKEILLIVDDCVKHSIMKSIERELLSMRHKGFSIIIITQYFKSMPPIIRSNLTNVAIFAYANDGEEKKMEEEYGRDFKRLYNEYTKEKYQYIWCDFEKNILDVSDRYRNEVYFDIHE